MTDDATTLYTSWTVAGTTTVEDYITEALASGRDSNGYLPGIGDGEFSLADLAADLRAAINDALPTRVRIHGNEVFGPYYDRPDVDLDTIVGEVDVFALLQRRRKLPRNSWETSPAQERKYVEDGETVLANGAAVAGAHHERWETAGKQLRDMRAAARHWPSMPDSAEEYFEVEQVSPSFDVDQFACDLDDLIVRADHAAVVWRRETERQEQCLAVFRREHGLSE